MMKRGFKFRCSESIIRDILGELDPDQSALVTYDRDDMMIVEFEHLATFDEFTVPNSDQVELLD